jgi:hypothetical protein
VNAWLLAAGVVLALPVARRVIRWAVVYIARPDWRVPDGGSCPECAGTGEEEMSYGYDTCGTCAGNGRLPDGMVSPPAAARLWQSARSLDDLGRLTARWLRGELPTCLTYGGIADPETGDLVDVLVELNEAGWLTDFSQPGHDWVVGWDGVTECRQRAAVTFLLDGRQVAETVAAALRAGLWVDARPAPRLGLVEDLRARFDRLPVSQAQGPDDEEPWMTCGVGFVLPRSHWRWVGRCWRSRRIGRLLAGAWQVTVVDPVWGEDGRLWPAMIEVARKTSTVNNTGVSS